LYCCRGGFAAALKVNPVGMTIATGFTSLLLLLRLLQSLGNCAV
jgi:hypothetical protein